MRDTPWLFVGDIIIYKTKKKNGAFNRCKWIHIGRVWSTETRLWYGGLKRTTDPANTTQTSRRINIHSNPMESRRKRGYIVYILSHRHWKSYRSNIAPNFGWRVSLRDLPSILWVFMDESACGFLYFDCRTDRVRFRRRLAGWCSSSSRMGSARECNSGQRCDVRLITG